MARRISFAEFRTTLAAEAGRLAGSRETAFSSILNDYVEFDPRSNVPKLAFRPDALVDSPPAGFDLDEELYGIQRSASDRLELLARRTAALRVVAEGDSWFDLPWFMSRKAIADFMVERETFATKNIARWGHTLAQMLVKREYLPALKEAKTDFFLFSGGGNDLVDELAKGKILHKFDPTRPVDDYLTSEGNDCLNTIQNGYNALLTDVKTNFPEVKMLVHGYDYPRPRNKGGEYIGKSLNQKYNIPWDSMDEIVVPVLDRLNLLIEEAASENGARYLDCRNLTDGYIWYDDMHPDNDGFEYLTTKFEEYLSNWP